MDARMAVVIPFIVVSGELVYYFEDEESLNVVQLKEGETYSTAARRYLHDMSLLRVRGTIVTRFNNIGIVAVRLDQPDLNDVNWYPIVAVQRRLNLTPQAKRLMSELHKRLAARDWNW